VAVGPLFLPQRVEIAQGDVRITVVYKSYDLKRVLNAAQFESGIPEERLLRVDY
jgi:Zn-dependent M32 family carboxypeptidase